MYIKMSSEGLMSTEVGGSHSSHRLYTPLHVIAYSHKPSKTKKYQQQVNLRAVYCVNRTHPLLCCPQDV